MPTIDEVPACESHPEEVSDETLMVRVLRDDTVAFGRLYDRHCRVALQTAIAVCHDRHRAEEAVQDAFLSIWRARARYEANAGSFRGWLLTAVRHRALDFVRHEAALKRPQPVHERPAVQIAGSVATPLDRLIGASESEALRGFLGRIPAEQAEIIALAFYGGFTHLEIAEHLSLPQGTVKGRMRLGLTKMRRLVDQAGSPSLHRPLASVG